MNTLLNGNLINKLYLPIYSQTLRPPPSGDATSHHTTYDITTPHSQYITCHYLVPRDITGFPKNPQTS